MNWQEEYNSKLISMTEAVSLVQSGMTLSIGIAASEPVGMLEELARQADRLENVTTWTCLPMRAYDIFMKPRWKGASSTKIGFMEPLTGLFTTKGASLTLPTIYIKPVPTSFMAPVASWT